MVKLKTAKSRMKTAQPSMYVGFNRKDSIERHKKENPNWYDKTDMVYSGKIKNLKGGLKKGTKAKESEIFTRRARYKFFRRY